MTCVATSVAIREWGRTQYHTTFDAMKSFTNERDAQTLDQIWLTEHEAVFTQGQAGKAEHLLAPGDIPVVQTDRGGQVTYHGPGQITAYLIDDLVSNSIVGKILSRKIHATQYVFRLIACRTTR